MTGQILDMCRTYSEQDWSQIDVCTMGVANGVCCTRRRKVPWEVPKLLYGYTLVKANWIFCFSSWKVDFGNKQCTKNDKNHHILTLFCCFVFLFGRFFVILQPIFAVSCQSVNVGRVLHCIWAKIVHAGPCEAMPLQQGGHWVGKRESHYIL